jgi:hypothetical protein
MARPPGVRRLAAGLALLALAACGDSPSADALRLFGRAAPAPAPIEVAGPVLQIGGIRNPVALLPLSQTGNRVLWRSDGHVALATDGPRIVATAGLGQMLTATRFDGPDPLEDPRALAGRGAVARRSVDLQGAARDAESMRFGVALDCLLRGAAQEGWLVIEERCTGPGLSFTNRFWADPETGVIRQSQQWVGDAVPMLSVQLQGV